MADRSPRVLGVWRSFAAKLLVLAVVLVAVPVITYTQLREADIEKRNLLLKAAQEQGRLIAQGLRPVLAEADEKTLQAVNARLVSFGAADLNVKVLFRPRAAEREDTFFYIAAWPVLPNAYLEDERRQLDAAGVLGRLGDSCEGNRPLAMRYTNPAGKEELITSLTPLQTASGCWVVITAHNPDRYLTASTGVPYWMTPEMQVAAAIYLGMVGIVVSLFLGVWRSLGRFSALARHIRVRGPGRSSFQSLNRIPELDPVAAEFDRLVGTLRSTAENIRAAAEENAHAFKTPIAVIVQSLEPLRRDLADDSGRARRAVSLIERSADRLNALVSDARQSERLAADLINPAVHEVDLGAFLQRVAAGFAPLCEARSVHLEVQDSAGGVIRTNGDLLETALDNVIDNAISYTPAGRQVIVRTLTKDRGVTIVVDDEGPGAAPGVLTTMFDKHASTRPAGRADSQEHFGLGLWIVRRNVEALGGQVGAENRPEGGLRVAIHLPRVR